MKISKKTCKNSALKVCPSCPSLAQKWWKSKHVFSSPQIPNMCNEYGGFFTENVGQSLRYLTKIKRSCFLVIMRPDAPDAKRFRLVFSLTDMYGIKLNREAEIIISVVYMNIIHLLHQIIIYCAHLLRYSTF